MGYTHYWNYPPPALFRYPELQEDLKALVLRGIREDTIISEEPNAEELTRDYIQFNGVGEENRHETFYLSPGGGWSFCKTARKPYDLYVVAALYLIKRHAKALNIDWTFTSDGNGRELGSGRSLSLSIWRQRSAIGGTL